MKTNLRNAIAVFAEISEYFFYQFCHYLSVTWMNEASSNVRDLSPLIWGYD